MRFAIVFILTLCTFSAYAAECSLSKKQQKKVLSHLEKTSKSYYFFCDGTTLTESVTFKDQSILTIISSGKEQNKHSLILKHPMMMQRFTKAQDYFNFLDNYLHQLSKSTKRNDKIKRFMKSTDAMPSYILKEQKKEIPSRPHHVQYTSEKKDKFYDISLDKRSIKINITISDT